MPAQTLSSGEAATVLGVSVSTVKRYVHAGRLRASITPGGQYRLYAPDVHALAEALDPSDGAA